MTNLGTLEAASSRLLALAPTLQTPPGVARLLPQDLQNCIHPLLRAEHVRQNCRLLRAEHVQQGRQAKISRIEHFSLRPDPIAIVCYGPSLQKTWEEIRHFRWVMTCSGAHRFLIDRGIIPTMHCEVDPRRHKIDLLGAPHPNVVYMLASCCHPDYVKHVAAGANFVDLWHEGSCADSAQAVPAGEWLFPGGCGVGLCAMRLARFWGCRDQHIFGMDGCEGPDGWHAAGHPNPPLGRLPIRWGGKTYWTTRAYLEAARQTFTELNRMSDVAATFHGEGLVQAMAKTHKPRPAPEPIAIRKPLLISSADLARQRERQHLIGEGYRWAPIVIELAACTAPPHAVLDYGCGHGILARALPFPIWEYDPAVSGKEESPRSADLVVCANVLEHVGTEELPAVLTDLQRCIRQIGYLIVEAEQDWTATLSKYFVIGSALRIDGCAHIIVGPR